MCTNFQISIIFWSVKGSGTNKHGQIHSFFYEKHRHFRKGFLKKENLLNDFKKPFCFVKQVFSTSPLHKFLFLERSKIFKNPVLASFFFFFFLASYLLLLMVPKRIFFLNVSAWNKKYGRIRSNIGISPTGCLLHGDLILRSKQNRWRVRFPPSTLSFRGTNKGCKGL